MKNLFVATLLCVQLIPTQALFSNESSKDLKKERLVGNILKNSLETFHYRSMKLNDEVSAKAFVQYLKRVDNSKQLLTKQDVKDLEVFKNQLDDQMVSGDFQLVDKTMVILKKRVAEVETLRKEIFKKQFDFNGNENLEIDPDKKDWPKDDLQWKENWRLIFKQATLYKYLSLLDEQSDNPKKKIMPSRVKVEPKKNKKEKKLTDSELIAKAHDTTSKRFEKIFERIAKEDREDQMEHFFNSVTSVYDPHTTYMPVKKKEDFDIDITGQLEGIGAVLQEDGSFIKVVQIVPGGAAWRGKQLEVDDVILSVAQGKGESIDLMDMKVDDAVRFIRGKKGTEVRLTVKKADGTRKTISIIRDTVQVEASFAKSSVLQLKPNELKIGYIHLPKFYRDFENAKVNCTDDVKKELERLKKAKVDGVILDLRNNSGGALEDAKLMSGLFIGKGPIVQVKNHMGQVEVLESEESTPFYDGPLIVLINRFSASASEILAGAIQDYNRGLVVGGDFSHGKGTVQAVINLNQGPLLSMFGPTMGALKVTIQKFYRVTGASTQFKGVVPDLILPDITSYADSREKDLEHALAWDQIAPRTFNKWNKYSLNIPNLKALSSQRVKSNQRLNKINKNLDYLNKRKKDTLVSLNLKNQLAEEATAKKMNDELKLDEEDKNLLVTNFEESLRAHENFKPSEAKKMRKDFDLKKDDWIKGLRQDAVLGESLLIMNDIVKSIALSKK